MLLWLYIEYLIRNFHLIVILNPAKALNITPKKSITNESILVWLQKITLPVTLQLAYIPYAIIPKAVCEFLKSHLKAL